MYAIINVDYVANDAYVRVANQLWKYASTIIDFIHIIYNINNKFIFSAKENIKISDI